MEEVLKAMRFWLDMGVDGLRLDAIPYLVERDGTNCENLPETHQAIKRIRRALDERYRESHAAGRGQPVAGGRASSISAMRTSATWHSISR